MEDELQNVKLVLKQWEKDFYQENQRRPVKEDIDGAPEKIARAYRRYSELKRTRQQPAEVWGKELNKNAVKTPVKHDECRVPDKNSVMSGIGKKLLAKTSFSASCDVKNTLNQAADNDEDRPLRDPQATKGSIFETAMKLINAPKPKTDQIAPMAASSFEKATSSLNTPVSSTFRKTTSFVNTSLPASLVKTTSFLSSLSKVNRDSMDEDNRTQTNNGVVRDEALSHSSDRVAPAARSYSRDISGSEGEDDDYASFRGKKQSKKKAADLQECKRALAVSPSGSEDEDNPKSKSKAKGTSKPRKKKQRVDKPPSSDNFVKLNMKVKKYQPKGSRGGGRPMTYRQRMMERRKNHSGDKCYKCGLDGHWARDCKSAGRIADDDDDGDPNRPKPTGTCFRCGGDGHWARQCKGSGSNSQPPSDWAPGPNRQDGMPAMFNDAEYDQEVDDNDFPSLEEAVLMSRGIKTCIGSNQSSVAAEDDLSDLVNDGSLGVIRSKYEKPPPVRCIEPLYRLNDDGSLPETPEEVYEGLQDFGFCKFRPGQETAVMRILCGLSTLVVQSTGAGKSLCYQLAAYLYGKRSKCITLVVSPLVSLMQDQVSELPVCVRGACIHTNMSVSQRRSVIEKAVAGDLHFLLMSPEMIVGSSSIVCGVSSGVLSRLPPIAFTCIDEAHCVSEWSHHFRPSYLRVCTVLREHYGVKCMLGLTATATMTTALSVARHLGIRSNAGATIRGAPIPDNLKLSVSRDGNREQALTRLLRGELFTKCKSIIVYCTRREQTTRVAALIRNTMRTFADDDSDDDGEGNRTPPRNQKGRGGRRFGRGGRVKGKWNAECYHAGLTPMDRKNIQEDFMCGRLRIVVATVAFGMGINKQDIHGIIHYTMPKNIESYVQEIGRAGRNGETAYCHLFLDCKGEDRNELKRHIFGRSVDRIAVKKLVRRVFAPCKCHMQSKKESEPVEPVNIVEGFDISGLDEPWDDDEVGIDKTDQDALRDQRRVGICPGHERALPINDLVHLLDMKEEVLETLLVYLELHPKKWIENQQPVFSQCSMTFYGGRSLMLAVAKKCPPVAVAIAQIKQKLGSLDTVTNRLDFNIVELSDMLGWDSGPVRKELKLLTWELGSEGSNKSGVLVDFNTLSYHFRSPGDLSDDELDEVVDFLMDRIETQEKTELFHLENFHEVLEGVSYKNVKLCSDAVDDERSEKLRTQLHQYLESDPPETAVSALSFTRELAAVAAKDSEVQDEVEPEKEKAIRDDVRNFVQLHGEDHKLSGRAIARIMHGIDSPRFPATSWGRNKRFWRSHLDVEFHTVRRIATRELVRCR